MCLVNPQLFALDVRFEAGRLVTTEVRDIDAVFLDADDVNEVVPGPGDDFLLEVVAE